MSKPHSPADRQDPITAAEPVRAASPSEEGEIVVEDEGEIVGARIKAALCFQRSPVPGCHQLSSCDDPLW